MELRKDTMASATAPDMIAGSRARRWLSRKAKALGPNTVEVHESRAWHRPTPANASSHSRADRARSCKRGLLGFDVPRMRSFLMVAFVMTAASCGAQSSDGNDAATGPASQAEAVGRDATVEWRISIEGAGTNAACLRLGLTTLADGTNLSPRKDVECIDTDGQVVWPLGGGPDTEVLGARFVYGWVAPEVRALRVSYANGESSSLVPEAQLFFVRFVMSNALTSIDAIDPTGRILSRCSPPQDVDKDPLFRDKFLCDRGGR